MMCISIHGVKTIGLQLNFIEKTSFLKCAFLNVLSVEATVEKFMSTGYMYM